MESGKMLKCECGKILDIEKNACILKQYDDPLFITEYNDIFGIRCPYCEKITKISKEWISLKKRKEFFAQKLIPKNCKKVLIL